VAVYLLRRLVLAATALLAVSFAAFLTFGLSFDPTYPMRLDPDQRPRHVVLRVYHLSDPILERYWLWLKSLFTHGFGSTVSLNVDLFPSPGHIAAPGQPIGPALLHGAGITLQLVSYALVLTVIGSALVGTYSARHPYVRLDVPRFVTYIAASMPTFLIAYLLRSGLAGTVTTTIVAGQPHVTNSSFFKVGAPTGGLLDWFQHMTLPAFALAIGLIGIYARYIRTAMLVSLGEQYTIVARAKGLPERRVVFRHALRNSLVPVVSLLSLELGAVVGASLAADAVFGLGGLAQAFLTGLAAADPFQLTALVVVAAGVVAIFLVVSDAFVGLLDPRIRVDD
jgi:ABC-type dipeptide/oligopeptide/nickel transport system permease component